MTRPGSRVQPLSEKLYCVTIIYCRYQSEAHSFVLECRCIYCILHIWNLNNLTFVHLGSNVHGKLIICADIVIADIKFIV